jgi:NADPH2:quinone reductase
VKAVVARAYGAPESFSIEDLPAMTPGPGEVLIHPKAAGVSFVDSLIGQGLYQLKPPLPYTPGTEYAGVVAAVGEGVTHVRVGDRVFSGGMGGGFAQEAVGPAQRVTPIPDGMDFREAAIFRVSYATAYYALVQRGNLAPGETLLVLGAGGATGIAAVEIGKALGARVVASASSPEKRALAAKAGADATIEARAADWRAQVKAAAPKGVDVVFDPIGGEATEPAFRSLGWRGRHLVIGFVAGIPKLPANLALVKGAALIGVDIRQFGIFEPGTYAANIAAIFKLYDQGLLHPPIGASYPLERFAEAMRAVSDNAVTGRVVLDID